MAVQYITAMYGDAFGALASLAIKTILELPSVCSSSVLVEHAHRKWSKLQFKLLMTWSSYQNGRWNEYLVTSTRMFPLCKFICGRILIYIYTYNHTCTYISSDCGSDRYSKTIKKTAKAELHYTVYRVIFFNLSILTQCYIRSSVSIYLIFDPRYSQRITI